jgi:hypothetical protein
MIKNCRSVVPEFVEVLGPWLELSLAHGNSKWNCRRSVFFPHCNEVAWRASAHKLGVIKNFRRNFDKIVLGAKSTFCFGRKFLDEAFASYKNVRKAFKAA